MSKALFPEIVVNGSTLSAKDIAAEAQNHSAPKGKPGLAWRKAARALAIRQLLLEEAATSGIEIDPLEVAPGKFETDEEASIRAILDDALNPAPVSENALRAVYDRDPSVHCAPTLYQPAHILFLAKADDLAGRAQAKMRADAALATLLQSPKRFGEIARSESECESREANGQLGQIVSGDTVPEFEAAMRDAPIGQVYDGVVETRFGFHILRMDARADGEVLPFEAVRDRLAEASEKANWTKAAHAFVSALLEKAEITGIDLSKVA